MYCSSRGQSTRESGLYATLLPRATTVVRNRGAIFYRFDIQSRTLKSCNCTFATTSGAFDSNVDLLDTKLDCLFSSLLSSHLTSEGCALSRSFESTGSSTRPTQSFTLRVGDRHGCIVKRRLDVSHAIGHITSNSFFL